MAGKVYLPERGFSNKFYMFLIEYQYPPYLISKQVWHWPYEAPGIVDSGLYAITIVCGPKDLSQEKYILI